MRTTVLLAMVGVCLLGQPCWGQEESTYSFDTRGTDRDRGAFSAETSVTEWDVDGMSGVTHAVRLERRVTYSDGTSELQRGEGERRLNQIRAELNAVRGFVGRLEIGDASKVALQFRSRVVPNFDCEVRTLKAGAEQSLGLGRAEPSDAERGAEWFVVDYGGLPEPDRKALSYGYVQGQLFVRGEGDADAIAINDIQQGDLQTCYLLAVLGALAQNRPQVIRDAVEERVGGTIAVRFHLPGGFTARMTMHRAFPVLRLGSQELAYAQTRDSVVVDGVTRHEVWPLAFERALAQFEGSYGAIAVGKPSAIFRLLTGRKATVYRMERARASQLDVLFRTVVGRGLPLVGCTLQSLPEGSPVMEMHAYTFVGRTAHGRYRFRDPYAGIQPRALTAEEVKTYFGSLTLLKDAP